MIPKDQYISKIDLSSRISNKVVEDASVYTNERGEEIVSIEFKDSSRIYIETNKDNIRKTSIRYWEVDLD
jgi:hypothetical protein